MLIVALFGCWFLGIWLASVIDVPIPTGMVLTLGLFAMAIFLRNRRNIAILLMCMGMALLGGVRYQFAVPVVKSHHIDFYNDNLTVNIKGTVIDEPDVRDRFVQLRVRADLVTIHDEETAVQGIILVQAFRYPEIEYGDELEINGRLTTPPEEGEFNYRAYLARQGIQSIMTFPAIQIVGSDQANPIRAQILQIKAIARQTINQSIADPQAALLIGILLGDDNGLHDSLEADFQTTGMTHIIAISGFNIAIIIWVLLAMARPFLSLKGTAIFATVGIALYTILVGADPPVVRAALMGGLYLFTSYWLGRPTFSIASLLWAAFIITVHDPNALWDVGFQLSFAATLSLMLFANPMTDWVNGRIALLFERELTEKLMGIVSESVIVTLTAQILTLPLIMATFGRLSLVSLVANAVILPAQPGVMLWGGLTTIFGSIFPAVGVVFGWVTGLFLRYTIYWVELLAQVPLASVAIDLGPVQTLVVYSGIVCLSWVLFQPAKKRRQLWTLLQQNGIQRGTAGTAVLATVLVFNWGLSQPDGKLHLYFLNVGQGDATLIVTPSGRTILIDGGFYPSVLNAELGEYLPFWQRRIDLMVATHPDADHVSGLVDVFARYEVERLITDGSEAGETAVYDAVLEAAEVEGADLKTAVVGEKIVIEDGITLQILHPSDRRNEENRNENSVSMRLTYGDFAYLFTGDAEVFAERAMLQTGLPLQSTVFKAGHHGSRTSSTQSFLEAVQPEVMIVSAGADNRFGHPHPELLARAQEVGATILRTDTLGTIELVTDGQQIWWFSHR